MESQKNNPLHGVTLKTIVEELVAQFGWEELGKKIKIKCFIQNPSVKSSLTFLRKTDWAREKVEKYYVWTFFKQDGTRK
ncbi:MAG: VF530 family protein [Candidatus Pacebacteria bacterium]|nr:VF530 family protein [Candidatus Paceibacterota bacterium]MCF7857564.1 VF530 family protein [Candidatus Paceibacterota bacterium]